MDAVGQLHLTPCDSERELCLPLEACRQAKVLESVSSFARPGEPIRLPTLTERCLTKVVEYLRHLHTAGAPSFKDEWESIYQNDPSALFGGQELAMFKDLPVTELGELVKASHYLDFHRLEVLSSSLLAKVLMETDINTLKVTLSSMH
ncbi:MAG: hypothetical protein KVP17_005271 [Porospora cf. gigantea B]|uniref:uncharacterized protein n=1 Tax=Porospora cf. gigantea B TaxID=2853592 RepID=UPI0035719764|nr:MAG: hypothetical protein KVP17_005271 [Porospora cf. gigantea B]